MSGCKDKHNFSIQQEFYRKYDNHKHDNHKYDNRKIKKKGGRLLLSREIRLKKNRPLCHWEWAEVSVSDFGNCQLSTEECSRGSSTARSSSWCPWCRGRAAGGCGRHRRARRPSATLAKTSVLDIFSFILSFYHRFSLNHVLPWILHIVVATFSLSYLRVFY